MQIVKLQNLALHVRIEGPETGFPVVFSNSLGTDLKLWDKVVALLPGGLRVIRFDTRGHGLSDCLPSPYSMDELANDAVDLLDQLGISGCAFVGLSIGGMIGQVVAVRRPDLISALVLSNTAAKLGDQQMWNDRIAAIQEGGVESLAGPILERWFSEEFRRDDELNAWRNMLIRTPKEGYIGCCHAIAAADLSAQTRAIRQPTLGIAGSVDGASPANLVEGTVAMIEGASFRTIEGAGHLPCVEKPAEYAAILTNFLKENGHV
ncbi:3-oxoadipate enol-lactonase [Cognatishimia sp. WU-CL00825]|uniref:3-oxoadipate enol-lactonase n=1 Tax=Cognatishimia sp. WU-CL00825 TaxID=3127658 RepID=UPI003109528F